MWVGTTSKPLVVRGAMSGLLCDLVFMTLAKHASRFLVAVSATTLLTSAGVLTDRAGIADAAPSDVTAAVSTSGSTVVVTVKNMTSGPVSCGIVGSPNGLPTIAFEKGLGASLRGGRPNPFAVPPGSTPVTFSGIAHGRYDIDWGCSGSTRSQWWGTPRTSVQGPATAQTATVIVGTGPTAPGTPPTVPGRPPSTTPVPTPPVPLPEWATPYWQSAWNWIQATF